MHGPRQFVVDGVDQRADVVLTDNVPEGLVAISAAGQDGICRRDVMAATEQSTVTVNVDVTAAAAGTTVTNGAAVASSTKDDDPSNNSTSVTDDVSEVLGLVLERPRLQDDRARLCPLGAAPPADHLTT